MKIGNSKPDYKKYCQIMYLIYIVKYCLYDPLVGICVEYFDKN